MIIAFDVDGTLINEDFSPIEDNRTLLVLLSRCKNVSIHVWSGGGEMYTRRIVGMLGLETYVTSIGSKINSAVTPDIAFDDMESTNLGKVNVITRGR